MNPPPPACTPKERVRECMCVYDRERERERQTDIERQRDRERERETERGSEIETGWPLRRSCCTKKHITGLELSNPVDLVLFLFFLALKPRVECKIYQP